MNRLTTLHIGAVLVSLGAATCVATAAPQSSQNASAQASTRVPQCSDPAILHMLGNTIRSANALDNSMQLGFHDIKVAADPSKAKPKRTAKSTLSCEAGLTLINAQSLLRTDTLSVRYTLVPTDTPDTYAVEFQPIRNRK